MSAFRPAENRFLILATRTAHEAMDVAGRACGVSLPEIVAKDRSRATVVEARHIAMYLAHVVGCLSLTEISLVFGRDRSSVAHACHSIEDRRDGEMFDRQIQLLELELRGRVEQLLRLRRVRPPPALVRASARRPFDRLDREQRIRMVRRPSVRRRPRSR